MFRGALVLTLAVAACGPITYAGEVHRASDAVDAARAVHADRFAPYWWTRAIEYLHEARELAGHSDYAAANRYGRLAADAARQAEQQATVAAKASPARSPAAPAKDHK